MATICEHCGEEIRDTDRLSPQQEAWSEGTGACVTCWGRLTCEDCGRDFRDHDTAYECEDCGSVCDHAHQSTYCTDGADR